MNRGIAVGFFASGAVLAAAVVMTVGEIHANDTNPSSGGPVGVISAPRNPPNTPAEYRQRWAADSLARPLFAPDRRPFALPSQARPEEANGLPRLSGIMITQFSRNAIFVPSGGGKPEVLAEGGRIGAYRVESISIEQVVLTGPHGRQSLHPTFAEMRPTGTVPPVAVQTRVKAPAP